MEKSRHRWRNVLNLKITSSKCRAEELGRRRIYEEALLNLQNLASSLYEFSLNINLSTRKRGCKCRKHSRLDWIKLDNFSTVLAFISNFVHSWVD